MVVAEFRKSGGLIRPATQTVVLPMPVDRFNMHDVHVTLFVGRSEKFHANTVTVLEFVVRLFANPELLFVNDKEAGSVAIGIR